MRAGRLADLAVRALIAEALLTPKPALVDQRGPGAHRDLDLARLLRSAYALRGSFRTMALRAQARAPGLSLREELGAAGRGAEQSMLEATGGSNAHRGAIWVLGLLIAALAGTAAGTPLARIGAIAARLARLPDRHAPRSPSNGSRVCRRYGVRGARGEAERGFPHVLRVGLPMLRERRRQGGDEGSARLDALMAIMMSLNDTCLLHRGGLLALKTAQAGATVVVAAGGTATARGWRLLQQLDRDLIALNASPGGSADLLAATLFLDFMAHSSSTEN